MTGDPTCEHRRGPVRSTATTRSGQQAAQRNEMILPTEWSPSGESLLGIGAKILLVLRSSSTVSDLWMRLRPDERKPGPGVSVTYGRFVLALDLLCLVGVVDFRDGVLVRTNSARTARTA